MANTLLTIDMITREAVMLFRNTNKFLQNIDMQYDDQFAKTGGKIGSTLRIRLPNDFTVTRGPAASVQDTSEQSTTLTVATQDHVDVSFTSADLSLKLDDFSKRILAPMINNLAGAVALEVMTGVEGGVSNYVANVDGAGAIISPTSETYLDAGARLDMMSAPKGNRKMILDPRTQARTVNVLAGLFNPQGALSSQYRTGQMQEALGFDWFSDQTVLKHTTATYSGSKTVNGAGQTGLTLVVNAITGGLALGEIFTIEDVNSVNRVTKQSNGELAQFVVTQAVASGGTSIHIYPAIVPPVGGVNVQYQTVDASPANGADINVVSQASEVYRKNIAYAPQAVTMATADLEMPRAGVVEAARHVYDGVSMRMISAYNIGTDQFITRLDVLYGYKFVRPEWAVAVADRV